MKKIFLTLFAGAAFSLALTSCNNAAETQKLKDEDNNKIQSLVDEKMKALEEQVNAECQAKIDSAATAEYAVIAAAAKKGGKVAVKPKPKPQEPKKEEPKKEEPKTGIGKGKIGSESSAPSKIGEGKVGTDKANQDAKIGKGKLGTQPK